MSMWSYQSLDELCSFISDGNWIEAKDTSDSGIRMLATGNIGNGTFIENAGKNRFISVATFNRLRCHEVLNGDCLIARIDDPIGRVCIVPDLGYRSIASVDCTIVRFNQGKVLPRWFQYYSMTSQYRKSIESIVSTESLRKRLPGKRLKSVLIPVPTIREQRQAIALLDKVIPKIDQLISLTHRRIQCAKELYDSCLMNSCKGPEVPIGDFANVATGKLHASDARVDGSFPYFTCSKVIQSIDSFAFDSEAVLLAGNNAKGVFPLWYHKGKFNASQRTYVIKAKDENKLLCKYLYYQIEKCLDHLKTISVGTDTRFLKIGMIRELTIFVPSINEQKRIAAELDRMKCDSEQIVEMLGRNIQEQLRLRASILDDSFLDDSAQLVRATSRK